MLPVSADVRLALPPSRPARSNRCDRPSPRPPRRRFRGRAAERRRAGQRRRPRRQRPRRGPAAGATDDLHGTMIAVKEAEIGVRLVGAIRNKLLDAFHEIWRTGV